jgi:hypothetical protein
MPRHAWVENDVVRDYTDLNPADTYHPDVAQFYSVVIPGNVERGWSRVGGTWTAPPEPAPAPPPAPAWTTLTPAQFVGLFSYEEEAQLTASEDPIVQVFLRRVYMPALTQVERDKVLPGLDYLVSQGILTLTRRNAILAGDNPE